MDDIKFLTTKLRCQIASGFFRGTQTVKDEGNYFSGSTTCQGRFPTVCDSILVVRLGLWVWLGLGLVWC